MGSVSKTKKLRIGGMTCVNCQNTIEKKLRNTAGVQKIKVSYNAGTAVITYDSEVISLDQISAIIQKLDYEVLTTDVNPAPNTSHIIGMLIIIVALYVLLERFGILNLLVPSQLVETNMGYGMLFVIGLITSVHCIAMCGGINLSQCLPTSETTENEGRLATLRPSFLYNLGRVISYTVVGFIVGALGSVITFSNAAQGILKLIAGIFMLIMGLNMLGIFPWLRKLNPRMPMFIARIIYKEKSKSNSPLIVGLLNGLMPCGPLQAVQIYALSTGNPITGAISMFLFSLGTVPLMFGLGALSSALGRKFTKRAMTVGAVLVAVLGLSMLSQGWSLWGISASQPQKVSAAETKNSGGTNPATDTNATTNKTGDIQVINSTLSARKYPTITVEAGTPVKWIIDAPAGSINGCNNRMIIQEYNLEHKFTEGENVIEFTPTASGSFKYSCWMGMIRATINVVEPGTPIEAPAPEITEPTPANVAIPTDQVAVAELALEADTDYQTVEIELTDNGYTPAIVVVQSGLEVEWTIINKTSSDATATLSVPAFYSELNLAPGENPLRLYPTKSFDFSDGSNKFYGYVKVVDDLDDIDTEAIKAEVANFQTMIYPADTFQPSGGGGGCCASD